MDDGASSISVGRNLKSAIYSNTHPMYTSVANMVNDRVSKIVAREKARADRAFPVIMTVDLDTHQLDELGRDYPEFRICNYGRDKPGHTSFVAAQAMANELLLDQACRLASSVTHLGGSRLSAMARTGVDVHIETSASYRAAVHARDRDDRNTHAIVSDYATLARDLGDNVIRQNYQRYLRREAYVCCSRSSVCGRTSEAFCADLSLFNMSPYQFCAAMVECGADVGYGFFPYHPEMLVSPKGKLSGTGIHFDKRDDTLRFIYPEGVMGVEEQPLRDWAAWLVEHVVVLGKARSKRVYHIQLSKARGPFMFFMVTRVYGEPGNVKLRHALDLPMNESAYVVSSAKLKDLAADPARSDSWERVVFTVPVHTVDSLVAYGMQLPVERFDRMAIRRQVKAMDRITLEGTSVVRAAALTHTQVDLLVTAIHARVFVLRYESGQLGSEMMKRLKAVARFGEAGFVARVSAVASWAMAHLWNATVGLAVDGVLGLCEWLEKAFGVSGPELPEFTMAPTYVSFETISQNWAHVRAEQYAAAIKAVESGEVIGTAITLKGSRLANALSQITHSSYQKSSQAAVYLANVRIPGLVRHVKEVELRMTPETSGEPVVNPVSVDEQSLRDSLVEELTVLNAVDLPPVDRHMFPTEVVVRLSSETDGAKPDYELDPDPVDTLNHVYEKVFPGVAQANLWRDIASLSQDDQDRTLYADYLRLPRLMDDQPMDREYYLSKVLALGAPKRQETTQELLSSVAARNLAAPKISLPQDQENLIPEVWNHFLDTMCVDGAREKLASYAKDPVALEEKAYSDWMAKAKPGTLEVVKRELEEESKSLSEMPVNEYLMMLKADVKPPLSDKPLFGRIEPQVIVYHKKTLSSMYSSIFRVLVRRFLSLLKPEIHVNLLKDSVDIAGFIRANHTFNPDLRYLENDFSKYDKSQDELVFKLESYVFLQLGMNHAMVDRWLQGHTDCRLRSVTKGISLAVRFQRKSGDATTAFGNVLLNILTVAYAYAPSRIAWGVFMGDDSLLACHDVAHQNTAVQALAEIFNLTAKMYITDAPYFASNFVILSPDDRLVELVPDPVKRIEKWSQPVSAVDPQWHERWVSAADACKPYKYMANTEPMARLVAMRYGISYEAARMLGGAIATLISGERKFRAMYEEKPEVFSY